jgi:threonine synthase
VIVSSSSGNAGAAAAAYAARAGLPCIVFTFKGAAGPMLTQMRAYGATVVAVETKEDRWTLMEHAVRHFGWFPTSPFFGPVVGSNPYGIEGYKTLAYEIAEALEWQVPDWCVLPVCYGDALVGMWRGFSDMVALGWTDRMPHMVAAEVSGSLTTALSTGVDAPPEMRRNHVSLAISIGATRGTFQALDIVRRSRGAAVTVDDDALMRWQKQLASEGIYVEPSTAAAPAATERLVAEGRIARGDRVVCLFTASGLKHPEATDARQPELLTLPAGFAAAAAELRRAGVFPDP